MARNASRHVSPWVDTMGGAPVSRDLSGAERADVLVVGAGVVGLTTALLLQRRGREVAVVEARGLAGSVTTHSTVKLTVAHGTVYSRITKQRDAAAAADYARANLEGMAALAELAADLPVDAELRGGQRHLVYAEDPSSAGRIEAEQAAAQAAGIPAVLDDDSGLPFPVDAALSVEDQATFHPGRYVEGLARAFVDAGGVLVTGVRATDVEEHQGRCTVVTDAGDVLAGQVVVATGSPFLDRGGHFARLTATRSYGVAGVLPDGHDPGMTIIVGPSTRSTRTAVLDGERLLVVVGEGHEVGHETNTDERWDRLRAWARDRFGVEDFRYHWSAEETHSDDGVPFGGLANPGARRVYTATGFAGWGMTNGTAAARLIADLATEGDPPAWAGTFDGRRAATTPPGGHTLGQNLHVARTWVRDRFGSARPPEEIASLTPGEGAVFSADRGDVAVSRDSEGELHSVSAVCTHLGCNVAWNRGEQSWDCPCHGSRFTAEGELLHGPASTPLEPRPVPDPGDEG